MNENKANPLVLKKRGEDGNRVISLRIKEDVLAELDQVVKKTNYSRNELINVLVKYGLENIEIK